MECTSRHHWSRTRPERVTLILKATRNSASQLATQTEKRSAKLISRSSRVRHLPDRSLSSTFGCGRVSGGGATRWGVLPRASVMAFPRVWATNRVSGGRAALASAAPWCRSRDLASAQCTPTKRIRVRTWTRAPSPRKTTSCALSLRDVTEVIEDVGSCSLEPRGKPVFRCGGAD